MLDGIKLEITSGVTAASYSPKHMRPTSAKSHCVLMLAFRVVHDRQRRGSALGEEQLASLAHSKTMYATSLIPRVQQAKTGRPRGSIPVEQQADAIYKSGNFRLIQSGIIYAVHAH